MGVVRSVGCGLVVAAGLLLGVGVPGATAYSISGGSYVGTATSDPSFTVGGGAYTVECPASSSTFAGTAGGWSVTYFRPHCGGANVCNFFGLPAEVKQDGSWGFTVSNGPSSGVYTGDLHIPAATTTTIEVPLAGCTVTITGTQSFAHGSGWNVVTGLNISGGIIVAYGVDGVAYTASGCPFSSGTDGSITATFSAPGLTIS